jgi:hypothetical protein
MLTWIGAFLVICSLLYMANEALRHRRLSGRGQFPEALNDRTLEPQRQRLAFLGLGRNWPGMVLFVLGVALLLIAVVVQTDLPWGP